MKSKNLKYIKWLSAEDMHDASKQWISELTFIIDEHLFFEDLIKKYTLQLLDKSLFVDIKITKGALQESKKRCKTLLLAVKTHENDLEIIVDGIDQAEEEKAYKDNHRVLVNIMSPFFVDYQKLKTELFSIIKKVLKKQKQQRLL